MHGIFFVNYIARPKIRLDFQLGASTPPSRFSYPLLAIGNIDRCSQSVQIFHLPIKTETFHWRPPSVLELTPTKFNEVYRQRRGVTLIITQRHREPIQVYEMDEMESAGRSIVIQIMPQAARPPDGCS
jgi:hypothetical protein